MAHELMLSHTLSNSDNLGYIAGVHETNVAADIGLRIMRAHPQDGTFQVVLHGSAVHSLEAGLDGVFKQPEVAVFAAVEECRREWTNSVVDRKIGNGKFRLPFQKLWDLGKEPAHLAEVAPKLALAGDKLFILFFELGDDAGLQAIAKELRSIVSAKPRCLVVTSSDVFLPWGMIYTHPVAGETLKADGSNWRKEGFWGYQHIVQQNPERIGTVNEIRPDGSGSVALSVNVDERIFDDEKFKGTDAHLTYLSNLAGLNFKKRTLKSELANDFTVGRATLERILYFYCHGHGSSNEQGPVTQVPYLVLSDGPVAASDFQAWSVKSGPPPAKLPTSPLVFINACQGGQMRTMFYQSFAIELLRQGAAGLVGVQVDVPAEFGSAYAQRVFNLFFDKSAANKNTGKRRLGPILREVNREMWDEHNNPLGLIYSLYRGVNCFIAWPEETATSPNNE